MLRFFFRVLMTLLGLWAASNLVAGFAVSGGWKGYLLAALVLTILNFLAKPVLKLVSFPLIIITLGLFTIVINAIILWLASQFTGYIIIDGLLPLVWGTVVISIINMLTHWI